MSFRYCNAALLAAATIMICGAQGSAAGATETPCRSSDKTSPLLIEEQRLINSPSEVEIQVIIASSPSLSNLAEAMTRVSKPELDKSARDAYYTLAYQRAILLHRNDDGLIGILNKMSDPHSETSAIVLEFEKAYFSTFCKYPEVVPVDTNSILEGILGRLKVQ